jgi:DNA-binding response OmpR family regulator
MKEQCPHCGGPLAEPDVLDRGIWRLEPHLTHLDSTRLKLTGAEANVLFMLAMGNGRTLRPSDIAPHVPDDEIRRNTVTVLVARLRKKLGSVCPVETVYGHGYRWQEQA